MQRPEIKDGGEQKLQKKKQTDGGEAGGAEVSVLLPTGTSSVFPVHVRTVVTEGTCCRGEGGQGGVRGGRGGER